MATLKGIKEIADYLYIGTATFQRHKDEIPHYRIGKRIFADTDILDEWMDKQIGNAIEAHTEIIRCNECDYWERYCNRETGRCDAHMMTTGEDDFCSWSERRMDGEK